MLKDTPAQYLLIRVVVFVLQWLGPSFLVYTIWTFADAWPRLPDFTWFRIWCVAESVFLLFFLWYRTHLQRKAVHPPLRSQKQRKALFAKVRREVHDADRYMSGWFRGAKLEDIGREEMRLFMNYAFWDGRAGWADEKELEYYVNKVEQMMSKPFNQSGGTAKGLRLTLDPIQMECRTLFWYSLIGLLDTIAHLRMRTHGFQYFKTIATSLQVLPMRPATWIEPARSPTENISYWIRPHTSKTRLPILYIHGIGVGLIPHVRFLHELDMALNSHDPQDGEVGILAIEILQISSRLTKAIPGRADFLQQITQVLDFHGYSRFVLLSHSYGSVLSTHILTHQPLSSRVSATLLIDPVTMLLHMPDVAYNFTIRKPKYPNEWLMWYFASKDPGVAHTLGRHFFWTENILWRDRVIELVQSGTRITASLSSKDLIVDTEAVGTYLTANQVPDPVLTVDEQGRKQMELQMPHANACHWKQRPWRGTGLDVMWWEGLDHAEVFDKQETRARLVDVLVEYSKGR